MLIGHTSLRVTKINKMHKVHVPKKSEAGLSEVAKVLQACNPLLISPPPLLIAIRYSIVNRWDLSLTLFQCRAGSCSEMPH